MSDNLGGKDYSDYFKSLERQMSGDESVQRPKKAKHSHLKTDKRKSGVYKVVRVRPQVALCALVIIVAVIAGALLLPRIKVNGKDKAKPNVDTASQANGKVSEPTVIPKISYSAAENTVDIPADNDAGGAIIINTKTHEIVAQRNIHEHFYPASTTKIMTLLVACENIKNFDDTFTMTLAITDPLYIAQATVAGFVNGETVTMTDMLYGLILPSGADAAIGLAIKIAGSEEEFVKLMNRRAEELGLHDTHFVNTSGLFDKNHYTSAYDMAIILETAIQNPLCKKILSTYQYNTKATPQHPSGIPMSATLFNYMYGTEPETATIEGGKTGFVNEAGYCIATFGSNNTTGGEYITVTLKNSSRWPAFHGQIALYKQFAK